MRRHKDIRMKKLLLTIPVFVLLSCGQNTSAPSSDAPTNEPLKIDVAKLHSDTLTLDTHVDIPLNYMTEINPAGPTDLQVDLGKLETGGLDAAFFIVYTPQGELTEKGYREAWKIATTRLKAIRKMVKANDTRITLAKSAKQVRKTNSKGQLAALIGMENAYPLGYSSIALKPTGRISKFCDEDGKVGFWAARGVRYMGITHFGHNQFGDSSNPHPERDNGPRYEGLSDKGQALIRSMNDCGVMVDVSHAGKATMMQAADLSRAPIIASHSGVKALADTERNLDDEQLRKLKEVGGVAQMVALDAYVKPYTDEQVTFREQLRKDMGLEASEARNAMTDDVAAEYETRLLGMWDIEPRASVADFVDHIDHAVKVAGIDHVGIASDFDGGGGITGWEDASQTQNVTAELVKRGYSKDDIGKIWGGNLLRVMEAAEVVAAAQK